MNTTGITSFQMSMTITFADSTHLTIQNIGLPSYLSFDTLSSPNASGGNSTFALVASLVAPGGPSNACIGFQTGLTCGLFANGGFPHYDLKTMNFPKMTLVSPAITPIPASILLFGTALAGLGLLRAKAGRRQLAV
jgi:hypothetical protein